MKKITNLIFWGVLVVVHTNAQVTFSEHIAPIIYENCTNCHREGEIAPFSLTNYDEVNSWARMIQYVTQIKYMPPWKPDAEYSNFVGERGLTAEEIQLISDWVDEGAPQGDPGLEPPLPDFPSGSQLGIPDLVLEMEEEYVIEGNNQDDYRVFVLPTGLPEDKEIAAIEFRAGNTKAVHHALIAFDTEGAALAKDLETPEYGYESFGDFGVPVAGTFTGYTPGIQSIFFPEGIGTTLPAGADLLIQVHYAPLATDETDKSSLNIFFKEPDDPITRELQNLTTTPFDLDGGFFSFVLPPDEVISFHGTKEIEEDISIVSIYPHAHYLGKNWEIYAETAEGDTVQIIRIDDWDFNWQGAYTFDRMMKVPAGSIIHINATYDNTSGNPFNPSNPPQSVSWGEGTTDEMYLVGMRYVPYLEGDENIAVGGEVATDINDELAQPKSQLYAPYPNPANSDIVLTYDLNERQMISIELFDIHGRLVKTILEDERYSSGHHTVEFNVAAFSEGIYWIRLSGANEVFTKSLVIYD